jgi:hypothetical protein
MENAPQEKESVFAKQTFDPDFQPLYALTEPQYQTIINQLSNLVIAVIEQYKQHEQGELAQQVAAHAYDLLRNYDDDIAEKIAGSARAQEDSEQRLFPSGTAHRAEETDKGAG